ncbi:Ground-like domain family protein [Brugia pahangi]
MKMLNARCDNVISGGRATQLILQLLITLIIMLNKPSDACFGGGSLCCPPSAMHCAHTAPPCSSTSDGCGRNGCGSGGSYLGPPPPAPLGVGAGGAYMQQPMAYVSSGSGPSYGRGSNIGALYQTAEKRPPVGGNFYTGGDKAVADNIAPGYGGGMRGSEDGIVGFTPPANIAPPPPPPPELPLPLPKQYAYNNGMMQPEEQLAPAAMTQESRAPEGKQNLPYRQPSVSENAYEEIVSDHEGAQQQQQQQLFTDKTDKNSINIGSMVTSDSNNKYDQIESHTSINDGTNYKTNSAYQSDTSAAESDHGATTALATAMRSAEFTSLESSGLDAKNNAISEAIAGYDKSNGNAIIESRSIETDDSTCNDPVLKAIIESTLKEHRDNLDAARSIESKASKRFGGRFNSIVSDSEFAYVNWYGKRNCQLQFNGRHSLTWED